MTKHWQDLRRSFRLFSSFRTEQTDPAGFYRLIADDALALIEPHRPVDGLTVLDIGGGPGHYTRAFREAGARCVLVDVARGSMPYSEVIHPSPWPLRKGGTRSSTLTVQSTRVSPTSISADPSACLLYLVWMVTGRIWSAPRPSLRMVLPSRFSNAGSIWSLKSPMRKLKTLPPAPTPWPSAAEG